MKKVFKNYQGETMRPIIPMKQAVYDGIVNHCFFLIYGGEDIYRLTKKQLSHYIDKALSQHDVADWLRGLGWLVKYMKHNQRASYEALCRRHGVKCEKAPKKIGINHG